MTTCYRRARIRKRTLEESSRSGSSAQVIASNADLLSEILLRLPIKSLLRFKSVSKQWLSLITHPHFARRKSLNSKTVSALYVECYSPNYRYYDLVPLDPSQTRATFKHLSSAEHPYGIEFLQSCNGLLCCRSVVEDKFSIYNPTTKQLKSIPPPFDGNFIGDVHLNFAFEPSKSHIYKAVCFTRTRRGRRTMIYSSETGIWRFCGTACNAPIYLQFQSGVYWNGAIHWVSPTDASFWVSPKEASIYFDLDKELLREMPMPPLPRDFDERKIRYFGESSGHLHLVEIYDDSTSQFNVYEMESDRSGWFVKFQVDLKRIARSSHTIHPFQILSLIRGEKEEDSFIVLCIPGQIIRYNFGRKTHQVIYEFSRASIWPYAFQYIESISRV